MKTIKIKLFNELWDVDLAEELPVKVIYKDTKLFGCLALFFGGSFALIPLAYFIKLAVQSEPLAQGLPLLPVSLVFLPLLLLGLNLLKKKEELVIDRNSISKKYSTLFKKEVWEEPLESYNGLLMRTDVQVTGDRSSQLVYALELLHREKSRSLFLYKSLRHKDALEKWKSYCRLFNCAALERIGKDRFIEREYDDMEKSLVELLREGKTNIRPERGQVPDRVEVIAEGESEIIRLPNKNEITIGRDCIATVQKGLTDNEKKFVYDDIAAVVVDYSQSYKKWAWSVVIVERDSAFRHVYAHDLPDEILEWLQLYLLDAIIERGTLK